MAECGSEQAEVPGVVGVEICTQPLVGTIVAVTQRYEIRLNFLDGLCYALSILKLVRRMMYPQGFVVVYGNAVPKNL